MAPATDVQVSKTDFIKEVLGANPKATTSAVNKAWTEAGNAGKISQTLVGKLRTKLGLSGNIRPGRGDAAATAAKTTAKTTKPRSQRGAGGKSAAATSPGSRGKSGFIKEVLVDNPLATARAVNKAWKAAGMKGTISNSLVSKIRFEQGLTGNLRSNPDTAASKSKTTSAKTKAASAAQSARKDGRPTSRDRVLSEVEGEIDRLIFKLLAVDGMEKAEDALRTARRIIVRGHKA